MRTGLRAMLVTAIFVTAFHFSGARIINAYERGLEEAQTSLSYLEKMPAGRYVKRNIRVLRRYIDHHDATERLLREFKAICPLLYQAIDNIRDRQGRRVDVHVKVVSREDLPEGLLAATNVDQLNDDRDACYSIYGPHTVSVKVTAVKHSLRILAHEFGHVSYQVRNLAKYMEFYKRCYRDYGLVEQHRGHLPADPSGRMALDFERRFRAAKKLIVTTRPKPGA